MEDKYVMDFITIFVFYICCVIFLSLYRSLWTFIQSYGKI